MNHHEQYDELKKEFRRLSIGKATLVNRIDFLRMMLEFAKKHNVAEPTEIQSLNDDLKKYELHYILNVCDDINQGKKSRVSFVEMKKRFQIANKFSTEIKGNPDYINAFNEIQKSYRVWRWIGGIIKIACFSVVIACIAIGWILFSSNSDLQQIQKRIESCDSGTIKEQVKELNNIQKELAGKKTGSLHAELDQKYEDLKKDCEAQIQKRQEILLDNITQSVGNVERYIQEVNTFLDIFPNETLQNQFQFEVVPRVPEYETILTFNRYWAESLKVEFPATFTCDANVTSPSFIPEWKLISQYDSMPEQIKFSKEKDLLKWGAEFFAKHDYSAKQEWASCKKDWSRCYYSSKEPEYNKEKKKYYMTMSLPDGTEKRMAFNNSPERAYYTDFAHRCWYKLSESQKKNYSFSENSKFWLDLLTKTANDPHLDPLYKAYYLSHTIQNLKLSFPTFYNYYLKELWEGKEGIGELESLLTQVKEHDLITPPEKKDDRIIVDDASDNTRREKAAAINSKIETHLAKRSKEPLPQKIMSYQWGGWIFDGKVLITDNMEKKAGTMFVLKWDAPNKKAELLPIGENSSEGTVLNQDLKGFDFQPVWIRTDF